MTSLSEYEKIMMGLIMLGWAFNLGILWQMSRSHREKIDKTETKIAELETRINSHHEADSKHSSAEWRQELRDKLTEMGQQLAFIQKQCLSRVMSDKC